MAVVSKGIIAKYTLSGSAEAQVIDLPDLPSPNARVAWVFEGLTLEAELIQGENGYAITVVPEGEYGVVVSPMPLYGGPDRVRIDADEPGDVDVILVRV